MAQEATHGQRVALDDTFDEAFAGEMARLESYNKHHYRPNSYLHKWWARRCGSTFRLILKHLVSDEARRDYYVAGGLEGKVVLDPMMGGGTTLHEAIRLGASVVGVDVDPIPVLQARASLRALDSRGLESAFQRFFEGLREALGPLWLTKCCTCRREAPLRFVLYGAQRACACGPVLLVDSLILRKEGRQAAYRLCARCHRVLGKGESCRCEPRRRPPLVEKGAGQCRTCHQAYVEDLSKPYYKRYTPLAVAGQCARHGHFFKAARRFDRQQIAAADTQRRAVYEHWQSAFAVEGGPKTRDLLNHGVDDYRDLFSSRQLLYMREARRLLQAVDDPVRLNLALLISTSTEFNSMLSGYKGGPTTATGARPGAIRHAFAYHAYSFPCTALENNVLYPAKASGTLQKLFHDRLRRAQAWARQPRERTLRQNGQTGSPFVPVRGEQDRGHEVSSEAELRQQERSFLLRQGSAASLPLPEGSVDYVVTDPPYYDNVQYSDLAAFFRVWLAELVSEEDTRGCRWQYDLDEIAVDSLHNGADQYGRILGQVFSECRRVLKADGRLIFTFHHWKPQSWAALTLALQQANFRLVNRYVVHAENPISVHIARLKAITDDAILVLAPAEANVHRQWSRPRAIDQSSSAQFCRDCATLLGWLLNEGLGASRVQQSWRDALAEDGGAAR